MIVAKVYSEFDNEINISIPYFCSPANALRLMLDSALVTKAENYLIDWNVKYPLYSSPATQIDSAIANIQNLFNEVNPFIQGIKAQLKNSMSVTLTGDDNANIFIHQDVERRAHVPIPKFAPGIRIIENVHLRVKISTFNNDPDEPVDGKLPKDVNKIGRKIAIADISNTPPAADAYKSMPTTGKAQYEISFEEGQTGKKAWIITWYINPTGEEGPHSDPAWFLIN